MNKIKQLTMIACAGILFALSGCSTPKNEANLDGIYDPYESTNRAIFAFNDALDDAIIHPAIEGYRYITPQPARTGLRNFLRHIRTPINFANQALQGDIEGSRNVLLRATINTFVGGFGVFDVAGHEGIPYEFEDFGQTLAVWGVDHGPYLVLPFFGGSTVRDYSGTVVEIAANPVNHYSRNTNQDEIGYINFGLSYLDLRDSLYDVLEDLDENSIDYYAAARSAYYQNRRALVQDVGQNISYPSTSDFDEFY